MNYFSYISLILFFSIYINGEQTSSSKFSSFEGPGVDKDTSKFFRLKAGEGIFHFLYKYKEMRKKIYNCKELERIRSAINATKEMFINLMTKELYEILEGNLAQGMKFEDLVDLDSEFTKLDENKNGLIDAAELEIFLPKIFKFLYDLNHKMVEDIGRQKVQKGFIKYIQRYIPVIEKYIKTKSQIQSDISQFILSTYDKNGDGGIQKVETFELVKHIWAILGAGEWKLKAQRLDQIFKVNGLKVPLLLKTQSDILLFILNTVKYSVYYLF